MKCTKMPRNYTKTFNLIIYSSLFQRKQLKKLLCFYWPQKISNIELYKRTKSVEWSKLVKRKRLSWLGHLMRLPKETAARKALQEYAKPIKKKKRQTKNNMDTSNI